MAFDSETRNCLAKFVAACRKLLCGDFNSPGGEIARLLAHYGIQVTGECAELEKLSHLDEREKETARTLRAILEHKRANAPKIKVWKKFDPVVYDLVQEQGFTTLNRLCALRMAEERQLVFPCVSKGLQSDGFQLYEYHTSKSGEANTTELRYQQFLFSLFDELAVDLGALFDRFSPQGVLFPGSKVLGELLDELNDAELSGLWAQDETIGWIYQYWNSKEERKAMRDASAAPRNSRELAVRNQFFTPRYVVEFLTDNTLGRIWYEMSGGATSLKDKCRYLVRRLDEVFMGEPLGDEVHAAQSWLQGGDDREPDIAFLGSAVNAYSRLGPPEKACPWMEEKMRELNERGGEEWTTQDLLDLLFVMCRNDHFSEGFLDCHEKEVFAILRQVRSRRESAGGDGRSQEELLKQPVFIPHRPVKDPREIRLLDPACGSMHFGLYAFDLFEAIYEEAWDKGLCPALQEAYPEKADYLRDVPRLIIEHNIHGVDIDPRAVQIAGLSLWLRAQKTWKNTPAAERPRVRRSNIVCAEPMPGSDAMLEDFVQTLDPPLLGELVKTVFDKMQLAGEAGALLKIEEEIRAAIDDAKAKWEKLGAADRDLFSAEELNQTLHPGAQQELTGVEKALTTDHRPLATDFFDTAEERIYAALRDYAESAEAGDYQRRLFAEDAAHGFAFIDLCRKRYEAVVMNPPFGEVALASAEYLDGGYRAQPGNLLCSFFERGESFAPNSYVGAITDSTWIKKADYEGFRDFLLDSEAGLQLLCDLGWGVLDDANVATCTFTAGGNASGSTVRSMQLTDVDVEEKGSVLSAILDDPGSHPRVFDRPVSFFQGFPRKSIAYETPDALVQAFASWSSLEPNYATTRRGYTPGNTFRYFRCWWEVPIRSLDADWWRLNNGGSYNPVIGDGLYVAFHEANWASYRPLSGFRLESEDWFGTPGIGWGKRTDFMYAYPLPGRAMFSNEGHSAFPNEDEDRWPLIAYLNSSTGQDLLNLFCGQHKQAGYVAQLPTPNLRAEELQVAGKLARTIHEEMAELGSLFETDEGFISSIDREKPLGETSEQVRAKLAWYAGHLEQIDQTVSSLLGGGDPAAITERPRPAVIKDLSGLDWAHETLSGAIGMATGRWDIRYATGERQPPELPDPFDPLPVCPPGMLQNADGLPATPAEVPDDYPLTITWPGILVSDPGHPEDIVARVRDALAVIWGDRSAAIEQEACEILGVRSLRDYFAEKKSGGKFFKDHLKRYSKSRRQAPIYWPLSTESGAYTLWIYYHRLTEDTLYSAVTQFIEPKQEEVQKTFNRLNAQKARSKQEDKELETAQLLIAELSAFRESLLEIAKFWKPNLNDGVQITAAPLWKHFRLPAWQKKLKETWKKLETGEYDWSHLAHSIWPERVIPKCAEDRSLAIAHGYEDDLWEEVKDTKGKVTWTAKTKSDEIAQKLVVSRQQ